MSIFALLSSHSTLNKIFALQVKKSKKVDQIVDRLGDRHNSDNLCNSDREQRTECLDSWYSIYLNDKWIEVCFMLHLMAILVGALANAYAFLLQMLLDLSDWTSRTQEPNTHNTHSMSQWNNVWSPLHLCSTSLSFLCLSEIMWNHGL